jgi:cystathionine gamma-lyase
MVGFAGVSVRKISDISAISEIAKNAAAVHVVDNTLITPHFQRALELGADLSLHSTTKYFDGHNATVGGAVIAKNEELDKKIRFIQNSTGSIMSPMVAWLTLQGCKTLSVRMEQQSSNAMAIAEFLEAHSKVKQVAYPGLKSFPQHELAKSQSSGFGAMLWFEVKGGLEVGKQLMDSIELWSLAENLGSVESLITHPVTMTHADVDEEERKRVGIIDGLVRLSVGLEDAEDLIEALDKALDKVSV